jgi:hypothetical protein
VNRSEPPKTAFRSPVGGGSPVFGVAGLMAACFCRIRLKSHLSEGEWTKHDLEEPGTGIFHIASFSSHWPSDPPLPFAGQNLLLIKWGRESMVQSAAAAG